MTSPKRLRIPPCRALRRGWQTLQVDSSLFSMSYSWWCVASRKSIWTDDSSWSRLRAIATGFITVVYSAKNPNSGVFSLYHKTQMVNSNNKCRSYTLPPNHQILPSLTTYIFIFNAVHTFQIICSPCSLWIDTNHSTARNSESHSVWLGHRNCSLHSCSTVLKAKAELLTSVHCISQKLTMIVSYMYHFQLLPLNSSNNIK